MADGFVWDYRGPDLSNRKMRKALKDAVGAGLLNHRRRVLPLHFRRLALERYPQAYAASRKARGQAAKAAALRKAFDRMTPSEKADYRRRLLQRTRSKAVTKDPGGEIPLVDSGKLERVATETGPATLRGPANLSEVILRVGSLPSYASYDPPGTIKKIPAMEAVAPDEHETFAGVVAEHLQKYFDSQT